MLPEVEPTRDGRRVRGRRADPRAALRPPRGGPLPRPAGAVGLRRAAPLPLQAARPPAARPAAARRSGLDVLREIRAVEGAIGRYDPALPVIVLSGRGTDADRVRGFAEGADDYVVKPFHYDGAGGADARGAAPARRAARGAAADRRDLHRPVAARGAGRRSGRRARQQGVRPAAGAGGRARRACSRSRSCSATCGGFGRMGRTRTLDSHASRLRRKLDPESGRFVINCWGVGYRLIDGREVGAEQSARRLGWPAGRWRRRPWSARRPGARSAARAALNRGAARAAPPASGAGAVPARHRRGGRGVPRRWSWRSPRSTISTARSTAVRRRRSCGRSPAGRPGRDSAVERWRTAAGRSCTAIELRWRAGSATVTGRPAAARAGARQPDRERDRARRASGTGGGHPGGGTGADRGQRWRLPGPRTERGGGEDGARRAGHDRRPERRRPPRAWVGGGGADRLRARRPIRRPCATTVRPWRCWSCRSPGARIPRLPRRRARREPARPRGRVPRRRAWRAR